MPTEDYLDSTGLAYYHNRIKNLFADKESLEALEDRVDDIVSEGGEPNVIDTVKVNGTALPVVNKAVDVTVPTLTSQLTNNGDGTQGSEYATKAYVSSQLTSVYTYKGSVATYADLPASGMQVGDVYDVAASGMNYAWTGTSWDALGTYVDTSLYWAKSELVAITTALIDTIVGA